MAVLPFAVYCPECGYDLRGQTVPRCPECGLEYDQQTLRSARFAMFSDTLDSFFSAAFVLAGTLGLAVIALPSLLCLQWCGGMLAAMLLPPLAIGWIMGDVRAEFREVMGKLFYGYYLPTHLPKIVLWCLMGTVTVSLWTTSTVWTVALVVASAASGLGWAAQGSIRLRRLKDARQLLALDTGLASMLRRAEWGCWSLLGLNIVAWTVPFLGTL